MSHVEQFAPGATTGTDLGFTVSFAGELKLDKNNDIIIGDRNNNIIDIFRPVPRRQAAPFRLEANQSTSA